MPTPWIHNAPGFAGLESLGARDFEDLFRAPGADGWRGAARPRADTRRDLLRVPLAEGGHALVERFRDARVGERLRARFTHPRSTSLAERGWNLACLLRASGAPAAEPLLVGHAGGTGFARRSVLVLREPRGTRPLDEWARELRDPLARRQVARAVGQALGAVFRAGVWLPRLDARGVVVSVPRTLSGDPAAPGGLSFGPLPEVVLADLRSGRIAGGVGVPARARTLAALAASVPDLEPRLALRALLAGTPRGLAREVLAATMRRLAWAAPSAR